MNENQTMYMGEISIGDDWNRLYDIYGEDLCRLDFLASSVVDDSLLLFIQDANGNVGAICRFSLTGDLVSAINITPIDCSDKVAATYRDFRLFREEFGEPHFDHGSGFYLPTYVVDNGSLLYFSLDGSKISQVSRISLLNGVITAIN